MHRNGRYDLRIEQDPGVNEIILYPDGAEERRWRAPNHDVTEVIEHTREGSVRKIIVPIKFDEEKGWEIELMREVAYV